MTIKLLNDKQELLIVAAYKSGKTIKDLSTEYNTSTTSIANVLRKRGIERRVGGKQPGWNQDNLPEIIERYKKGESLRLIAKHFGVRSKTISKELQKVGVFIKPAGQELSTFKTLDQKKKVLTEYESGKSLSDLAEKYGCSVNPIKRAIVEMGGQVRPIGLSKTWTKETEQWATEAYQSGMSQQKIAEVLGITQTGVSTKLLRMGVITKPEMARGSRHGSWKGGRISSNGYISIKLTPDDDFWDSTNSNGYILEHRLVMARHLGRPLSPSESVHHINGDRADNRIKNLQLRQGQHGTGIVVKCLDCGSHNISSTEIKG